MARFVLQPYRLVQDRFVPSSDPPLILTWEQLRTRLAPTNTRQALMSLRTSRLGSFLGLITNPLTGQPSTFQCQVHDGSGRIGWILQKDQTVAQRILEVYRLEESDWGGSVVEATS